MEQPITVTVDPSCFPGRARGAYLESFRTRRMDHQFHYASEKQAQLWLALHEAYSPARTDGDCLQTYERAFSDLGITGDSVALISFGCGGGQKDAELLKQIDAPRKFYVPSDVSLTLALTAHLRTTNVTSQPLVLDFARSENLETTIASLVPNDAARVIAFFGMMPNFEPADALPRLTQCLRPNDSLILSANLAAGEDYLEGVKKILPLYNNALTRRWLAAVLQDAGLNVQAEELAFSIEKVGELLRVEVNYRFGADQEIRLDDEHFKFQRGENFRLFFSYRHTPKLLDGLLRRHGIAIEKSWITKSAEEGIFLCRKTT